MLASYEMDVMWEMLHDLEIRYGVRFHFMFHDDYEEYLIECCKNGIRRSKIISCVAGCTCHLPPVQYVKNIAEHIATDVYSAVNRSTSKMF